MPWEAQSARRARLPPEWQKTIRPRILARDPICRDPTGCTLPSTDVDHVINNDDHTDANLQGLCAAHHAAKTQREAATARARNPKPTLARPNESHPGHK